MGSNMNDLIIPLPANLSRLLGGTLGWGMIVLPLGIVSAP
jgi:hypothetical protein